MAARKKTYPLVKAAEEYARRVVAGKIVACKWIKLACQRHLDDLERAKEDGFAYYFDPAKAEKVAKFLQLLPHTKGKWASKRELIKLEGWQLFSVCIPFGWLQKKDNTRRFRTIVIFVPRKNGKSIIGGGLGIYMFTADGEFGAEVYSGATTEKQAWEVFRPAKLMVERTPELKEHFGVDVNASNMCRMEDGSRFEPVIGKRLSGRCLAPAQHVEPGVLGAHPLIEVLCAERGLLGRALHSVTLAGLQEVAADGHPIVGIGLDQRLFRGPVVISVERI